jgi:hypothetical protein
LADAGGPGFAARLLSSPRRRRRLRTAGILLALGGILAFVGLRFANTGHESPEHFSSAPVQTVAAAPKTAVLSSVDREVVRQVAAQFIDTAVLRRHVDDSWPLTTAKLRQGLTRKQWDTGSIPVTPYPADAVQAIKYVLDWSGEDLVYLKIAIEPKTTSNSLAQAFDIGLTRSGRAAAHRWLVDYWVPLGGGVALPTSAPLSKAAAAALPAASEPKSRLPVGLVFVPVGLLIAFLIGLPALVFGRQWQRNRRAVREYQKHQAQ